MKTALKNFRDPAKLGANIDIADQMASEKAQGDIDAAKGFTPQRAAFVSGKLSKDKAAGKFFQLDTGLDAAVEEVIQAGAVAASLNFVIALGLAAAQAYKIKTGNTLEGDVNKPNFGLTDSQLLAIFEDKNTIPAFNDLIEWSNKNRKAPEKRENGAKTE